MPPTLSALGERLRERTEPLQPPEVDERNGWLHAHLCEALMLMLQQVGEIWDPEDPVPPHTPLLDPALAPAWALPWVAQLVGVRIPDGTPTEAARTMITDVAGFRRGTAASLRAVAGLYLTGNRTVYFRERDGGDPYVLEVVTVTAETPDPAAVQAALKAAKPGGLILNYRTVAGWDYQQMTTVGGPYSAQTAAGGTYRNQTEH